MPRSGGGVGDPYSSARRPANRGDDGAPAKVWPIIQLGGGWRPWRHYPSRSAPRVDARTLKVSKV